MISEHIPLNSDAAVQTLQAWLLALWILERMLFLLKVELVWSLPH